MTALEKIIDQVPSIRRAPALYAGALVLATFAVVTAAGIAVPSALPYAAAVLAATIVKGATEVFKRHVLGPYDRTSERGSVGEDA